MEIIGERRLRVALIAAMSASPVPAVAQETSVEQQHAQGMALREEGRHAEAAALFRDLFDRTREPRALARWGLAVAASEDWARAEEILSRALAMTQDRWVQENRAGLERNLARVREHLADLVLDVDAPEGEVWVNGARRATLPLRAPIRIVLGRNEIELRVDGRPQDRRAVDVGAGGARIPLSAGARAAAPTAAVQVAPEAPTLVATRSPPQRTWGMVALALGGAGVALGGVGLALRNSNATTFNERGCLLHADRDDVVGSFGGCIDAYDLGNTWEAVGLAGFAVGGALAATGIILLATAPRAPESASPQALRVRCGPTLGALGAACGGSF